MQNYFSYFSEIEDRFQQRRGTLLMLSTLDWALIDTWREAAVPLSAVLAGIDDAFDRREAKQAGAQRRQRTINGLAWCAQSVMEAAERQSEAATGVDSSSAAPPARESGFEADRLATFLESNAAALTGVALPGAAAAVAREVAERLRSLAAEIRAGRSPGLEALDTTLTSLESRLVAALITVTPEASLLALRDQAVREIAPYRGKMKAVQIRQVQQQMLEKRLLRDHALPRLSLFYMSHE